MIIAALIGFLFGFFGSVPIAGPIAALPQADRFHWLTAPKSAIVQVSPVHSGICDDPAKVVEHLLERTVRLPS